MEKSFTETMMLRTSQCDMRGQWRPCAILESMQETAGIHCDRLGIGRPVMDGLGIAWVLSRTRVVMKRMPRTSEVVSVTTWPLPPKHMFYPRVNAITDAAGNEIGAASSLWLLMDFSTRRAVNSEEVLRHLPVNADMPAGIPIGAARPLAGTAEVDALVPPYADFDLNGHVNNTRCLDWTLNALGHDALAEKCVQEFCVSYDREIRPGEQLRTELVRNGDAFSFCGFAEDKRCFCVSGSLADRE